jgi:trehalose-phosphatase
LEKRLSGGRDSEVQVHAVFLDYDGTISPINVPRSQSKVTPENLSILNQIKASILVAVISTKDLAFITKRTPFAHAWAGLGGLETKIGDVTVKSPCLQKPFPHLAPALNYAKSFCGNGLTVEEKRDSEGKVVAFSVDWRQAKSLGEAQKGAFEIFAYCKALPMVTVDYGDQPFFDVFPCQIDKGKAILDLKQRFGLGSGILYLGDSVVDNSAFEAADIAVCVVHEGTSEGLFCDYFVGFADVHVFLEELLKNKFRFNADSSKVLQKTWAF